jgi:hypothetical protein
MKFAEFFFKIRDGTDDDGKLFDYEVVIRSEFVSRFNETDIKSVEINHEEKKIYIWMEE